MPRVGYGSLGFLHSPLKQLCGFLVPPFIVTLNFMHHFDVDEIYLSDVVFATYTCTCPLLYATYYVKVGGVPPTSVLSVNQHYLPWIGHSYFFSAPAAEPLSSVAKSDFGPELSAPISLHIFYAYLHFMYFIRHVSHLGIIYVTSYI